MQKAATQRCRRDSSIPQAAGGQTEARSAPQRRPIPAPHSCAKDPAPADQATSRLQLCDAAQAKARARARQAQTNAPATAPRAINQTQLASRSPAPQQAPPRANRAAKAAHATHSQPGSPGAVHRPAPERSCASSRAAQQHPQAQLPAPQHPAPRAAEPPAASCRSNRPPPAAPRTTAAAAQTTTAPAQDARPHAALPDPPARPANTPQAHKPSAPQTGCGSIPQHQGSNGSG